MHNKSVLAEGANGSIGFELCLQIALLKPSRITPNEYQSITGIDDLVRRRQTIVTSGPTNVTDLTARRSSQAICRPGGRRSRSRAVMRHVNSARTFGTIPTCFSGRLQSRALIQVDYEA